MRGIKKIEHIIVYKSFVDTDCVYYDKSEVINEMYRITYAEGQIFNCCYSDLPKKAKKFCWRKSNYIYTYNQAFRHNIKYTTKINTYTFIKPI